MRLESVRRSGLESPISATAAPSPTASRLGRLRRELGQLATLSVSIGVMAPTLAVSITGVAAAGLLGRAASLAYVVAALGVGLVAYGFARLSAEFSSAGSVYAFVGGALGPGAGFVAGWALLGTYLIFPVVSISAIAIFGQAFLHSTGIAAHAPWLPLALVGWALVWLIASRDILTAARTLLLFEVVSVALILVVMAIIFGKLAFGGAPAGRGLSLDVFSPPPGTSLSTIALASVFGFLSYAGFESAASLGEESTEPRRMIPRAMAAAIAFGAVFYVVCIAVQTLGFGTDAAGVRAFAASPAPLGELAKSYVGTGMADALNLAAIISAIGAGLGCASVAARMLFALGRDRLLDVRLAAVSPTGAPGGGLAFVMALDLVILVVFGAAKAKPFNVFFYFATIGTLSLLAMYALTNVAAARFLAVRGARAELALPVAGIAVAGYVLYHNVWPVPDAPYNAFPYIVAGWLVLGVALAVWRSRA
ncbi:MAG: APC family permease [Solirubrobacteraceae bacterium]